MNEIHKKLMNEWIARVNVLYLWIDKKKLEERVDECMDDKKMKGAERWTSWMYKLGNEKPERKRWMNTDKKWTQVKRINFMNKWMYV